MFVVALLNNPKTILAFAIGATGIGVVQLCDIEVGMSNQQQARVVYVAGRRCRSTQAIAFCDAVQPFKTQDDNGIHPLWWRRSLSQRLLT